MKVTLGTFPLTIEDDATTTEGCVNTDFPAAGSKGHTTDDDEKIGRKRAKEKLFHKQS